MQDEADVDLPNVPDAPDNVSNVHGLSKALDSPDAPRMRLA